MFLADLHIHSRFSRATAKDLTVRNLDAWARIKGIDVIGTGDFTHPKWREELHEHLERDDESGLYRLRGPSENLGMVSPDAACLNQKAPLFCLQTEISSIYKKDGRVRKVHNLIYVPTLEDADRLSERLGKIGNITSDGRPILGLDSRDLLELLLETVPEGILIPAHIWTPWFSLFGSRSGFDRIEECFEDLTPHIFALETGLSSDPPMNRYVSSLDRFALVSNSDAHSGSKLGREVNLFEGTPGYSAIFNAIRASAEQKDSTDLPARFLGTLEFFPEEGKYHLDGHRACQLSLNPLETRQYNGICPVCGKPLTIGVLHRVMELADRAEPAPPEGSPGYNSIMPLLEITAELLNAGTASMKVQRQYGAILSTLGSEMAVLATMPLEDIRAFWPELGEGITRLREGRVHLRAGYDGEFGQVRLFEPEELGFRPKTQKRRTSQAPEEHTRPSENMETLPLFQAMGSPATQKTQSTQKEPVYSREQTEALSCTSAPTLVLAGPGTGKTHLLLGRIDHLIRQGVAPERILALTFTRRAAREMRDRIATTRTDLPVIDTLHAFCWKIQQEENSRARLLRDDEAFALFHQANTLLSRTEARHAWSTVTRLREECALDNPGMETCLEQFRNYRKICASLTDAPVFDFTALLEETPACLSRQERRFDAVLVDEVQDCSPLNIRMLQSLAATDGQGFFAIGDPDQTIYGFRGACRNIRETLQTLYPGLTCFQLGTSYRSCQDILTTAQKLLVEPQCGLLHAASERASDLHFCTAEHEKAEARWIAQNITDLVGSTSHSLQDSRKHSEFSSTLALNDIAVLVRFRAEIPPIENALRDAGIPVTVPAEEEFWNTPWLAHFLELCDPALQTDEETPFQGTVLPDPEDLGSWIDSQPWAVPNASASPAYRRFLRVWTDCGSWPAFFERLLWLREDEAVQKKAEAVHIMTLHASKGLEFSAVFIPGLEDGLLPAHDLDWKQSDGREDPEEERRLFYVGITRASQILYLSCAQKRTLYGREYRFPVSPFFTAISDLFQKSRILTKTRTVHRTGNLLG